MNRREQLFNSKQTNGADATLVSTRVRFTFHPNAPHRTKGELRQLAPEEKAMCALRKVFAQMSADTGGERRYFIVGEACRILERQVSPGAKEGDPGSYLFRGRCPMGIAHKNGDHSLKMIEFVVSFRDIEDAMGLPDVDYFDPTTIDEIDPRSTV
jgi:hypothetical protein